MQFRCPLWKKKKKFYKKNKNDWKRRNYVPLPYEK